MFMLPLTDLTIQRVVPLDSLHGRILDLLEKGPRQRSLRASPLPFAMSATNNFLKTEKPKPVAVRTSKSIQTSFKTLIMNMACLRARLTRLMTRRRTRSMRLSIGIWMLVGEFGGTSPLGMSFSALTTHRVL